MPNAHINANLDKTMSPATGVDISQDLSARRAIASFLKTANKRLGCPPPPLYKYQVISFRTQDPQLLLCCCLRARAASLIICWVFYNTSLFPVLKPRLRWTRSPLAHRSVECRVLRAFFFQMTDLIKLYSRQSFDLSR